MMIILACILGVLIGAVLLVGSAFAALTTILVYAKWVVLGIAVIWLLSKIFSKD